MTTFWVYAPLGMVFIVIALFGWFGKLPSIEKLRELAETANTKGGNILLLFLFSMMSFFAALRCGYYLLTSHEVANNPMAAALFGFISGSVFGGSFTAMVKAMNGEASVTKETPEK